MTIEEEPLFLQNPEWYEYDEEKGKYVLTESAPIEAQKSYMDFYGESLSGNILASSSSLEEKYKKFLELSGGNPQFGSPEDDGEDGEDEEDEEEFEEAKKIFGL